MGPEISLTVYGASKVFVLFVSQRLDVELSAKDAYVQASSHTEI